MEHNLSFLARTNRGIRRAFRRLIGRLRHKADIQLTITMSLPPFLTVAFEYKVDLGRLHEADIKQPANDNHRGRYPRHSA